MIKKCTWSDEHRKSCKRWSFPICRVEIYWHGFPSRHSRDRPMPLPRYRQAGWSALMLAGSLTDSATLTWIDSFPSVRSLICISADEQFIDTTSMNCIRRYTSQDSESSVNSSFMTIAWHTPVSLSSPSLVLHLDAPTDAAPEGTRTRAVKSLWLKIITWLNYGEQQNDISKGNDLILLIKSLYLSINLNGTAGNTNLHGKKS